MSNNKRKAVGYTSEQKIAMIRQVTPYPDIIKRLLTAEGFFDAVAEFVEHCGSVIKAYELVEAQRELYFGARKYGDYAYFIQARSKVINKASKK